MSKIQFRQQALQQLSSPEQLDQMRGLVPPGHWLALVATLLIFIAVFLWSLFGQIPVTVSGQGILLHPAGFTVVDATNPGILKEVLVKPGDKVAVGDVLAHILEPETNHLTLVKALHSGTVQALQALRGSWVNPGDRLMLLTGDEGNNNLTAVFFLSPDHEARLTKEMSVRIYPANVASEDYGYILADLHHVSSYPMSAAALRRELGHELLAEAFAHDGPPLAVYAAMLKGPGGHYRWSSKRTPGFVLQPGNFCRGEIIVGQMAPIDLLIRGRW